MAMLSSFIRFVGSQGDIHYGKADSPDDCQPGSTVPILEGHPFNGFQKTDMKDIIRELLCPLESTPLIICVGLNYRKHAIEAGLSVPSYPVVFTKPADAMTGPFSDVSVHPKVQTQLDYEGELVVVIGRDGKNISEEDALDYVLGYTCGNDVSARDFQLPGASGGQFCYAKSFDGFAPIGPRVVFADAIPDPQEINYTTKVNGRIRQQTSTGDMIWTVRQIIAHLSQGTTLRKGTLIMTGTPSGVGNFTKSESGDVTFLKDGDVVEVEVEGIGAIINRVVFE